MGQSFLYNFLTNAARGEATHTQYGITFSQESDGWVRVSGTCTSRVGWRTACSSVASDPVRLAAGTYTLSAEFDGVSASYIYGNVVVTNVQLVDDRDNYKLVGDLWRDGKPSVNFTVDEEYAGRALQLWGPVIRAGMTVDMRVRYMLVEGTEPAAWAPAEGEELAGGGCSRER